MDDLAGVFAGFLVPPATCRPTRPVSFVTAVSIDRRWPSGRINVSNSIATRRLGVKSPPAIVQARDALDGLSSFATRPEMVAPAGTTIRS